MKHPNERAFYPFRSSLPAGAAVALLMMKADILSAVRSGLVVIVEQVKFLLIAVVVFSLLFAIISRICVSPDGIRGTNPGYTKWSEITEVVAVRGYLFVTGFRVRSTYKNTVWVAQSVWTSPEFARAVQECGPGSILDQALASDLARRRMNENEDRKSAS